MGLEERRFCAVRFSRPGKRNDMNQLLWLFVGLGLGIAAVLLWRVTRARKPVNVDLRQTLQQIRQVGQLVVLRMYVEQIVTAEQHIAGRWKDLFKWLIDSAKMALIIQYDVEVLFDLQDSRFRIEQAGPGRVRFLMPPCQHKTSIRNLRIYDERHSRWLPWLLGDITAALGPGLSEERKNQLLAMAREEVEQKAQQMVLENRAQILASARQTLEMLAQGFGIEQVEIQFESAQPEPETATNG